MDDIRKKGVLAAVDKPTIILFLLLVTIGWLNIYAAVFDPEKHAGLSDLLSLSLNSGKQLLWIGLSSVLILLIFLLDFRLFERVSYPAYAFTMAALVAVLLFGREINGARSWFDLGFIRIQPAEFTKIAVALAISKFIAVTGKKVRSLRMMIPLLGIIGLPGGLIVLQGDTGSAMVFAAFFIVFYREGLPHYLSILGLLVIAVFITGLILSERQLPYMALGMCVLASAVNLLINRDFGNIMKLILALSLALFVLFGVNYFVSNVLKPHQQARIKTLVDPDFDRKKSGYQVVQSKIAIGSGGFTGKGFLKGTQTKFNFVPEQSTDFIFCTIGEEWGWMGSLIMIILFSALLYRLMFLAERQRSPFSRIYGYCVTSVLFFHFTINIGMTIGLFPVIGIPLPFFSYGGSSLWSFTILLFIMVKLDAHRMQRIVMK